MKDSSIKQSSKTKASETKASGINVPGRSSKGSLKSLVIAILIPEAVGLLSGLISGGASRGQYEILLQPPFAPPPIVFPIIWPILYLLMGIASWLVWRDCPGGNQRALRLYAVQLAVNFLWPIFFFNLQMRLFAFFWLCLLLVLVWLTILAFSRCSRTAALLMIPYLLWSCFALYLNLGIWLLNG